MALKNKISIHDRNVSGIEGPPVGQNPPSDGMYFTSRGTSDSPFDTIRGPKMDQMVQMLTKNVKSDNSGQTYTPAPNESPYQDLDGADGGQGYFQLEIYDNNTIIYQNNSSESVVWHIETNISSNNINFIIQSEGFDSDPITEYADYFIVQIENDVFAIISDVPIMLK